MLKRVLSFILSIALALAVGGLSAFLTRDSMNIYEEIATPPPAIPSIVFPIVWGVLFVLMGISAALIYNTDTSTLESVTRRDREYALSIYLLSLAVNFVWSIIFFNFRAYLAAFIWLLFLLYLVVRTILLYRKINPAAAYLQIPYAAWVSFAGYLTFGIWLLNK